MHLQDARCMNSFSNRSAGRLPHRIVPFSRDGGGKRATQASCTAQVIQPGSEGAPLITRGSLHPQDEVRLTIMNITGDVPPAGRSLPAIQGIPAGRPEVSTLTVTLGELASRVHVLPRWLMLSLNITKPNQLCLRALLSASPSVRTAQVGARHPEDELYGRCVLRREARPGRTPHPPSPHPLPGTAEGSDGHLPHQTPSVPLSPCASVYVCVYISISIDLV